MQCSRAFFPSEKQCYSQLFYFKICVLCQNVCLNFGLCDSIHCQFTQCYFNIECQMVENTAYCSHAIQQTNWVTDLGSTLKINVYGIPYRIKPRSRKRSWKRRLLEETNKAVVVRRVFMQYCSFRTGFPVPYSSFLFLIILFLYILYECIMPGLPASSIKPLQLIQNTVAR